MKDRLLLLLDTLKIKQKDFAEGIGLKPAMVNDVLKGRAKGFSSDTLIRIRSVYNVSIDWLLVGDGEMFISAKNERETTNDPLHFEDDDTKLMKEIIEAVYDIFQEEKLTLPSPRFSELIVLLFEDIKADMVKHDNIKQRALKLIKIAV